ncbi:MAG TPA: pilus assembly protein N-terminal domain-containing protein [Caulobacteraceae bacterium]
MRTLALTLALALAPVAALAATLAVPLDQSAFVSLPGPAHNVIIGNPAIADVAVADQRHLIITGKGAGVTNLLVTDASGRPVFDRQIIVGADAGGRVTMINGGQVTQYTCAPQCQAASGPAPGGLLGAMLGAMAGAQPRTDTTRPSGGVEASPNIP